MNIAALLAAVTLLDFDDPATGAILVNNLDFYRDMSVLAFLRDVGKHFTINYRILLVLSEGICKEQEYGKEYSNLWDGWSGQVSGLCIVSG